ncbi:hypothetical protein [Actinomyces oris]|jgi:putative aminomethyltransferase (glycine cleavage system tprotein)|uniref:hypothetical protein n=1 Tax=Actinomyces oris TaxID=544580 RepID=UPI00285281CF|nr:hypothetical protein [Actinomyces oris]
MTAFDEYQSLRTTFAVYPRGRAVARVSGPEREGFLSGLLARTVEFSGPGTLLESLVLDEEGRPIDQVLVLVEDDDLLVLSDDPARFLDSLATEADSAGNVTVEILPGATSLAVEGPAAWRAVAALVNGEIATLALGEFVPVHIDGVLEDGKLARTGTTGEYGYVLTGRCDADQLRAYLLGAVKNAVGVEIGREALLRASFEVAHPMFPELFAGGLGIAEAGAQWLTGLDREDDYRGRVDSPQERTAGIVAVRSEAGHVPAAGTEVTAAGEPVGTIHWASRLEGAEDSFGLALLEVPWCVPGLELEAGGVSLRTVSRPAVEPRSWTEPIG